MLKAAESAYLAQKSAYESLVAKPRDVDLEGLKASINQAGASYQLIKTQRDNAFIKAPFDGTIRP